MREVQKTEAWRVSLTLKAGSAPHYCVLQRAAIFCNFRACARPQRVMKDNEVIVLGKDCDAVCALVDIDSEAVGNWADKQGLSYTGFTDLVALDDVYRLIGEVITETNAELANDPNLAHAQVHRFVLLPKRLEPDDGEVTRMRKVRREVIAQRFASLVQALYDDSAVVQFDAPVRYENGSTGQISAPVMIGNARVFAAPTLQKAA